MDVIINKVGIVKREVIEKEIVIPNLFRNLHWISENLKRVQVDVYNSHSEEIVILNSVFIAKRIVIQNI